MLTHFIADLLEWKPTLFPLKLTRMHNRLIYSGILYRKGSDDEMFQESRYILITGSTCQIRSAHMCFIAKKIEETTQACQVDSIQRCTRLHAYT
jgi:hypothetical protein